MHTLRKIRISYQLFDAENNEDKTVEAINMDVDGGSLAITILDKNDSNKNQEKFKALKLAAEALGNSIEEFDTLGVDNQAEQEHLEGVKASLKKLEGKPKEKESPGRKTLCRHLQVQEHPRGQGKEFQSSRRTRGRHRLQRAREGDRWLRAENPRRARTWTEVGGRSPAESHQARRDGEQDGDQVCRLEGRVCGEQEEVSRRTKRRGRTSGGRREKRGEVILARGRNLGGEDTRKSRAHRRPDDNLDLCASLREESGGGSQGSTCFGIADASRSQGLRHPGALQGTRGEQRPQWHREATGRFREDSTSNLQEDTNAAARDKCLQVAEKLRELEGIMQNGAGATRNLDAGNQSENLKEKKETKKAKEGNKKKKAWETYEKKNLWCCHYKEKTLCEKALCEKKAAGASSFPKALRYQ
jgi:hypothetical protein